MAVLANREALIAQAVLLRRAHVLKFLSKEVSGKEVFLDTSTGTLRSLWYGFESPAVEPVYFDMHGGGFVLGSADQDEGMNQEIAKRAGIKIVSIEYCKAPEHPYPEALYQAMEVVAYVKDRAEALGIDKDRMAIGGHSAGGNLAAAACMRAKGNRIIQFACQILDYPPLDLASDPRIKFPGEKPVSIERMEFYNRCYFKYSAHATEPTASPIFSVLGDLSGLPPALFILPGKDPLSADGLSYAEMLRRSGVETQIWVYPESDHGFTKSPSPDTSDAVEKMITFLKKHLFQVR